jgi:hypothetical protein
MWLFTRPGRDPADLGLMGEFRELNPWFREVADAELGPAIVSGPPGDCLRRIEQIACAFDLDLPVADLSGLAADAAADALRVLAPKNPSR